MNTNRRKPRRLAWALLLLAGLGGWFILRGIQDDGGTGLLEERKPAAERQEEAPWLEGRGPELATRGPSPEQAGAAALATEGEPGPSRLVKIEGVFRRADNGEPVDAGAFVLRWSPGPQHGRLDRHFDIPLRSDANGRFDAEINLAPVGAPGATVRDIWTKDRRWRCHAFYPEGGEVGDSVIVSPGAPGRIVIELAATLSLNGVVVDPQGHPLSGVRIRYEVPPLNGSRIWYGALVTTGVDGTFAIVDVLARPEIALSKQDATRASLIHFRLVGFNPLSLDALAVEEADHLNWRVSLSRGLSIEGVLLDDTSRPLSGVKVEAVYDEQSKCRRVVTDAAGRFTIPTLAEGRLTLRALVLDQELEARMEITLSNSVRGLELFAEPIPPAEPGEPISAVGIRLTDTTEETRRKLGLPDHARVVVVDPDASLMYIGPWHLPAGSGIWKIGSETVTSAKHTVERILAEYEKPSETGPAGPRVIRLVYIHGEESAKAGSSSTQFFFLFQEDYRLLRRTAISLR